MVLAMKAPPSEPQFVVVSNQPYDFHIRLLPHAGMTVEEKKTLCLRTEEFKLTEIPIEAWGRRTGKDVITRWCPRCKSVFDVLMLQVKQARIMPHAGDVIFFDRCRKTPKAVDSGDIGFRDKAVGFGVMLGIVPPGAPAPPPVTVPRMMGELGYLKFDDVIDFFGKEMGDLCIEKFKDKYYGKIVEGAVAGAPLKLVGPDGNEIEVKPEK